MVKLGQTQLDNQLQPQFSTKMLQYFLQLAQTMNYTKTATQLGITQSALTQQIKKLERQMGATLFYLEGKKLYLTDAGYTFKTAVQTMFATLNSAYDKIQTATQPDAGEIRLGLLSSIEGLVLTDFIAKYHEQHPHINFSLQMMTRSELWKALENNTIDIAVMYLPDANIKNWQPYTKQPLTQETLMCVDFSGTVKLDAPVALKNVPEDNWVMYPASYYLNDLLLEKFKNDLVGFPHAIAHLATPEQILMCTKAVAGTTALPTSFVNARHLQHQAVHFNPPISFELACVYRHEKANIPRMTTCLQAFSQYLSQKNYAQRLTELSHRG